MSTPDQELKYKLTTVADTSGAEKQAAAIREVSTATTATAKSAVDQGKSVNALGENMDKGAAAGRVLSEVMRGNVLAIGQLGPVLKAVGAAFIANPLFLIGSIAATVVLPAIAKIVAGWKSVGEQAAESGKIAADAAGEALKGITERRQNTLAAAYKEIADRASEARANIDAVTLAQTAQIDADEAVAMAELQADKSLSEVERVQRTAALRRDFRGRRTERELGEMDTRQRASAAEVANAQITVGSAREDEARARRLAGSIAARSPDLVRRELEGAQEMEKRRLPLLREASRNVFSSEEERQRRRDEAAEIVSRRATLEAELADADANHAKRMADAQAALEAATKARADEEAKAAAKAAKAAAEANQFAARRAVLSIRNKATERVEQIEAPAALAEARRKDTDPAALTKGIAPVAQGVLADSQGPTGRAVRANLSPQLQQLARAVDTAAEAALEGGTTLDEADALTSALEAFAQAMAGQQRNTTQLVRRLQQVEAQIKNARTL